MVNVLVTENIFKIGDQIPSPITRTPNQKWFTNSIIIKTSDNSRGTTLVIDFSFTTTSMISYTLDGEATVPLFVPFNNAVPIQGGQSRFLRVNDGNAVNFRALASGTLNRCIVGEV